MTRSELLRAAAPAAFCLLALLGAGDARAFEVCGDGVCSTDGKSPETATSCPEDCGGPTGDCENDVCTDCDPPGIGDKDLDGIPDSLEFDLAHAFFPQILLQWEDVDRDESYLFEGFPIPFTMVPVHSGDISICDELWECLEIRYGIAFFKDHGDVGGLGAHLGDSETYAAVLRRTGTWVDTQNKPEAWEMIRDFTSAHWGAGTWDSSQVGVYGCPSCVDLSSSQAACNATPGCGYSGYCTGAINQCYHMGSQSSCESIGACTWNGGCHRTQSCYADLPQREAVKIFAAESKHALYHTDDECDEGALWFDDCPQNKFDMRLEKDRRLQNVGNSWNHELFDVTIQHPDRCHLYPVWEGGLFGEATAYKVHFTTPIDWQFL